MSAIFVPGAFESNLSWVFIEIGISTFVGTVAFKLLHDGCRWVVTRKPVFRRLNSLAGFCKNIFKKQPCCVKNRELLDRVIHSRMPGDLAQFVYQITNYLHEQTHKIPMSFQSSEEYVGGIVYSYPRYRVTIKTESFENDILLQGAVCVNYSSYTSIIQRYLYSTSSVTQKQIIDDYIHVLYRSGQIVILDNKPKKSIVVIFGRYTQRNAFVALSAFFIEFIDPSDQLEIMINPLQAV
jgi:hypothetical protein